MREQAFCGPPVKLAAVCFAAFDEPKAAGFPAQDESDLLTFQAGGSASWSQICFQASL
jgi:hypothetical protein